MTTEVNSGRLVFYPTLRPPVTFKQHAWRMLLKSKTGMLGLGIIILVVAAALFAEWLSPHDPLAQDIPNRLQGPVWMTGNANHLLGTDALGRDLLSRVIHGSRISLLVGLTVTLISCTIGLALGLTSGYFRGAWDTVVMRTTDVFLALPGIILALTTLAVFGPGLRNVVIMLGLTSWEGYARVVRGNVLATREEQYVEAAHAIGVGHTRILLRHILPNVAAPVVILSSLRIGGTILVEASLSFLGLGVQPPTPTWGGMVSEGLNLIFRAWWVTTFPGLAIFITVLGINLLGDWLRDVLDPRMRI